MSKFRQTLGAFALSGLVLTTQVPEAIGATKDNKVIGVAQNSTKITVGELLKHDVGTMSKGCLDNYPKYNYNELIYQCIAHAKLLSFSGKNFLEELKKSNIDLKKLVLENKDFFGKLAGDIEVLKDGGDFMEAYKKTKISEKGKISKGDEDIGKPFFYYSNTYSEFKILDPKYNSPYELIKLLEDNGIKLEDFIAFVKGILPIK